MKREYQPITVKYKKKFGKRIYKKTFYDLPYPDRLLTTRGTLLPPKVEILHIGVGKSYISK